VYRFDTNPNLEIPGRPGAIETIRLIRKHVEARIAALSGTS
jgi:hypothetical protein